MRGITNAQGITGPHLNGILERLSLLENNPPVGSVTTFAGFDWVVVHWDTALKRMYLMLKGISTKTTWADSASEHVPYENSNVKAELISFNGAFERLIFGSHAVTAQRLEVSRLEKKGGAYAFIPTKEEFLSFCLFEQPAVSYVGDDLFSHYECALVRSEGLLYGWWLSGSGKTDDGQCYYIGENAEILALDGVASETSSGLQYGVRPFIIMKMR